MTAYLLTDKGRIAVRTATRIDVVPLADYEVLQAELAAADKRLGDLETWIVTGLVLEGPAGTKLRKS